MAREAQRSAAVAQQKKVQSNVTADEHKRLVQARQPAAAAQALLVMRQLQDESRAATCQAQSLQASLDGAEQEAQEAAVAAEVTALAAAARQAQLANVQLFAAAAHQATTKLQQLLTMHAAVDAFQSQASGACRPLSDEPDEPEIDASKECVDSRRDSTLCTCH